MKKLDPRAEWDRAAATVGGGLGGERGHAALAPAAPRPGASDAPTLNRAGALVKLFAAYRQQLDDMTASIYVEGTRHVSDANLVRGVDHAIKTCAFLPSVAALLEACRDAAPVIDGLKQLVGVIAHDGPQFICQRCHDTSWVTVPLEHPEGYTVDAAERCPCWRTNERYRASVGGYAS